MSQFAREYPEDYQERLDAMLEAADLERKRRREDAVFAERIARAHEGDPSYEGHLSPRQIIRQQQLDRETDG